MNESLWNRIAAATGLAFVASIASTVVIGEVKDFTTAGDYVTRSSNEAFGTTTVLTFFAALFFLWFLAGLVARLRQLEGGSGRLSTTALGAGVVFAAILVMGNALQVAARQADEATASVLTSLSQEIFFGPVLVFPVALLILAAGVVGTVTRGLPLYSAVGARLSILTADALLALASLWLFRDLAWLDETTLIVVLGWVAMMSVIGILRWGEPHAVGPTAPDRLEFDDEEEPAPAPAPRRRPARKEPVAKRSSANRKPKSGRSTRRRS